MTGEHTYMGESIYRCERASGEHRGGWIVQAYHETGMLYADEQCPHYGTLAAAREAIRDAALYAARAASRAGGAIESTVTELQASAHDLYSRMIDA